MSQTKKMLLFAIIPAIIAGLFAIAPKAFDIITKPKALLEYDMSISPGLEGINQFRKILSINVQNTGKKSLNGVLSEVVIDSGVIEASKIHEESSLKPKISKSDNTLCVEVKTLHPSESYTISAMLLLDDDKSEPKFNLRSDEILGVRKEVETEKSKGKMDIKGSVLSGVSVFLMAAIFLLRSRGKIGGHDREDIVFYILVRLGLYSLSKEIRFSKDSITYLRTSDVLLSHGLHGDDSDKKTAVMALKCLLLVKNMAEASQKIIIGNLKVLEGDAFQTEAIKKIRKKSVYVQKADSIREEIGSFINDPDSFLKTVVDETKA